MAIQKKLGISGNANQMLNIEARRRKSLADSYELLLDLVDDLINKRSWDTEEFKILGKPLKNLLTKIRFIEFLKIDFPGR